MSKSIVLLDGGMGQELIKRSNQPASPMWSAKVMMDEPEIVEAIHRDYLDAGAMVLTLNTYSATPERLARDGNVALFEPLQAKAIQLAKDARGNTKAKIAGCLPPLHGSYNPQLAPELDECISAYRAIVEQQADDVDFFMCETMASIKEVTAAVTAAVETGKPAWCCITVDDQDGNKLRSGEDLLEAALAAKNAGASAILINCSWPEAVTQAMPTLGKIGLPFGGYANGFTNVYELAPGGTVDGMGVREDLNPKAYAKHTFDWIEQGATIIGGCCEVGPVHIKEIADQLNAGGYEITGSL